MIFDLIGKRKQVIINPEFQWKLIGWSTGLSVVTSLIYFISNFLFFRNLRQLGVAQNLPADAAYFQFIDQQQHHMNLIFAFSTFFAVCLIIGFGIFISHRIAGPIYRICKLLNESVKGKLTVFKTRQHDFFPELPVALNQYQDKIK